MVYSLYGVSTNDGVPQCVCVCVCVYVYSLYGVSTNDSVRQGWVAEAALSRAKDERVGISWGMVVLAASAVLAVAWMARRRAA